MSLIIGTIAAPLDENLENLDAEKEKLRQEAFSKLENVDFGQDPEKAINEQIEALQVR